MKIEDIKPYERNARDNSASIPAIAESIKQFGFIGQIALESKDNPTIVAGHHRVEALKLLGWSEIPDQNICFCDHLTEDEIKALRLADNRTHEGGKWNKGLLKSEVKALQNSNFDMSKFNFDFKSNLKGFQYGQERLKTDDAYNLSLVNISDCDETSKMPTIRKCEHIPQGLQAFNYCKSAPDHTKGVHFYIDDYQFERLWNRPTEYLSLLEPFDCVLTPDFSLYMDMPYPMQEWNVYRARALGHWWQRKGLEVIVSLTWSDENSYDFSFGGLPRGGTYATSTVGCKDGDKASEVWRAGMKQALKVVKPDTVIVYGGKLDDFNFGKTKVIEMKANTAFGGREHGR